MARPQKLGRPTKAQQIQRHEQLLNVALDTFLELGFDGATTEEIAVRLGMSKRTVYAHYQDKAELFKAAIQLAVERYTVSKEDVGALEVESLEDTLKAVARQRIANIAKPISIKLHQVLSAQSPLFPGLFVPSIAQATRPTVEFLADLFLRHMANGSLEVTDAPRLAHAFLSLAASGPARLIMSGQSLTKKEIEDHVSFATRLFLNGACLRNGSSAHPSPNSRQGA